jgi:hypothetical protein
MDEKIRLLAEQAGLMKKRTTTGATVLTRAELQKKRQLEKFAELIIRDLCKVDRA